MSAKPSSKVIPFASTGRRARRGHQIARQTAFSKLDARVAQLETIVAALDQRMAHGGFKRPFQVALAISLLLHLLVIVLVNFKLPEILSAGFSFSDTPFLGVALNGRLLCYYLLFFTALASLLALLRIVNSPFGRVLQAIRENEFRAEAIGYRVVIYRTISSVLSALFATLAPPPALSA